MVCSHMRPLEFVALLQKHFAPRTRRVWISADRAHVELRLAEAQELSVVSTSLKSAVERHPELHWAEVHQGTGRVVMAFRPDSVDVNQALAWVVEAELQAGLARAVWDRDRHPLSQENLEELFLQTAVEAWGVLSALGLKLTLLPRSRLAGTLASVLLVVRSVPRLRRPLDRRFGQERTDLGLGLLTSLLEGPAHRPLIGVVGVIEKVALAAELRAQKRLFEAKESTLCALPGAAEPRFVSPRPVELPPGPIEEYADRAWAVALASFGVSFLSTGSVQRAFGALFGSIPRPARLGREVFASALSRLFAGKQMLVLNRDKLRLLDRVDTLVIQGDLMPGSQVALGRVVALTGESEVALLEDAKELFDAKTPLAARRQGEFVLAPLGLLGLETPAEFVDSARNLARGGELVLGLTRQGRLVALVEVRIGSRLGLEELVQAAHDARMRVIVAADDPEILQSIPADDTLPGGDGLWRGVRELQREGSVVCVVAQGDSSALDVADLGVAVVVKDQVVPWSADVLCLGDLNDVRFLIDSCKASREVSRQSVNVALGSASLGALASIGGILPLTTNRVLTVVNLASLVSMANGMRLAGEFARRPLAPPRDPTPWHALEAEGVLERLGTSLSGLHKKEALERHRRHDARRSAVFELATAISDELFNPLTPLLAAGAALSAVVGSMADAVMVGGVVVLNASVGGFQRFQTDRAITELGRSARFKVHVRRDGVVRELSSDDLVKGDIVVLASGDVVPADCRIVDARALEVDASGLTGESLPVSKSIDPSFEESVADRASMLYAGTAISSGGVTAVVVATGNETEARRGAAAFRGSMRESGVERRMRELMDLTAPIALTAGIGVIGAGLLRGRKLEELVGSAVSLAVASVPEGLPLLATAAQLAAARRLKAHGALVRNVRSLEALGRVDTICVDKTGTVTEGAITLGLISDGSNSERFSLASKNELEQELARVLATSLRASPPRPSDLSRADPVEIALWRAAEGRGVTAADEADGWQRLAEITFDASRGYHAVLGATAEGKRISVKGAPEALLELCGLSATEKSRLTEMVHELANDGYRVLGVAERPTTHEGEFVPEVISGLEFTGLLAFRDPVRKSAKQALADLRRAGLRPVMITGDHPSTARAIFAELGLSRHAELITGPELAALSEEALGERVLLVDIFARVSPSQKVRVVRALQRKGRTVAMVGDGANDAPAIRLASVGVAMGEKSSEAARNAADIVLKDARIETLVHAIIEGRAVWDSVRDAVSILVGGNLGEIGFTLLGGLVSGRPPLSPRQLLLVNLFTDVAPATALALRAPAQADLEALVDAGPEASLGWRLQRDIGARAVVTASGAGIAWAASSLIGDRRGASTTALLALVGTQLGQTLISGERSRQVVLTSALTSLFLGAIVQTPGISGTFGCRPLGPLGWGIALGSSVLATAGGLYVPDLIDKWTPESVRESLTPQVHVSRPPSLLPLLR